MYKGRIEQNLNQLNIPNVIQSDPQYEELCGKGSFEMEFC